VLASLGTQTDTNRNLIMASSTGGRSRQKRIEQALEDDSKEECKFCHKSFEVAKGGYERHYNRCKAANRASESLAQEAAAARRAQSTSKASGSREIQHGK
jgi:hypothetical protein